MAIEPATEQTPEDYKAHLHDYSEFIHLIKYGAIAALVTALFVVWLIS